MKEKQESSRRSFIRKLTTTTAAVAVGNSLFASQSTVKPFAILKRQLGYELNDQINIALIGAGGMGNSDTDTALKVPGVKLVAVCDLYDGRLKDAKAKYGADIFTTRVYKEILNRKDIDAVIIATPDHWHQQISVDAMHAGKHVYCEKPMVHAITEGPAVIKAQQETGKIFQVGSQGVSSLGNEKAHELLKSGAIGQLNYAEGFWARREPLEVWQYPIPADASPQTLDWETYISNTKKRPFDEKRFFRWRNYTDYGTGMAGDLFVHLFSSLHFITDSMGPNKIYASGGLRFWNDGREVPDVLLGTFDYGKTQAHPAFNLSLRCNFVDGTSGTTYLKLVGSEGSMDITWDKVTLKRNKTFASDDPFYLDKLKKAGVGYAERKKMLPPEEITYDADKGYMGGPYDHMVNFFTAIRNNGKVTEDAVFGYRAAAPALLCNDSYYNNSPMFWDPEKMQVSKKS
ncbi:Gfo/Idh/MocA family oxidoreductase [Mucilaginibacter sp. KACC 22773]|jgi:predicted dehydrogenase|uniref:Gfo/Idh/MocA family protein n=1 Tax=Mucilaginibacter sp. KACC 22773 TaxID=3025671 RepID=UPI002366CBE5|nr:Gfo/Idh/MocA family oxidoreductase [Mucilaginibacter sp. KACC 22773]WDF79449.1 Gfo/Idh/MocA family oxidoreductase [Mucilaginibacter sp. KACC 22773]